MTKKFNHRKKPRQEECVCGDRMINTGLRWWCLTELEENDNEAKK